MALIDIEQEKALIAEALRSYDRFAARGLTAAEFTDPQHVMVLEAAQRLQEAGERVSLATIALDLQRAGKVAKDGMERALAGMAVSNGLVPDHDRIRKLARCRALVDATHRATLQACDEDLLGALGTLSEVDQLGAPTAVTRTTTDLVERVLEAMRDRAKADERRVYLGMRKLDAAIGKLPVGSLMIVAADSSVGKSSFSLAMLMSMAEANVKCGLISIEDPEDTTAARFLSALTTSVSSREIQHGRFAMGEREAFRELSVAAERAAKLKGKLFFEDRTGETELDVCAAMGRMAALGAKLVVVDYIQEVSASKTQQDRRNEVRWIAKRLKTHAKRLGLAIVLVSQIARPKDGEEFKEPSKHSLKESGDLTNSAEVILVLWRDRPSDDAPVHVKVQKCKWGGLGIGWSMARNPDNGAMMELL